VKCYLSCDTCSGPRRDQCVRCPNGWKLAAGECHPECPEGFFKTEFGCQKCHHYCKTCNGKLLTMTYCFPKGTTILNINDQKLFFDDFLLGAGPLSCTSCSIHFMLEGGLCTECLSMQYYDSLTQTCKTCHESCRSCSGPGQYSCVTCAFPLHLDRLNNQCVPCCATDATPEDQSCCHCDKDTGMLGMDERIMCLKCCLMSFSRGKKIF
jgi:proprotein convertase subtilisin/kexin type 5